ncbi:formate dehydrogenase accessory sulfurtransferase FdhD [Clostridium bowmanii]|uniref:formate dehydrogenase accessory sulfurtransferase FdhD n=1 Tax=Clostridium bowmanii TaxID=132925 RepID=UPI001C0B7FD1|nr:formate dehydrogenase accessory sulfurtransferase FdhD [Clostridium bowmanii]MBU3188078.1 formate dehydrogenase accessory sulfurtransferase FdhD [Clostridium bowmanii]MCA1072259.1 formate dehydrogenase accessory sulfurtransferase FdhD [Clostridium bowmanii]
MNSTRKMNIRRINNEKQEDTCDLIIEEVPLELFVNYDFYAALMCTAVEVRELAIGFLFCEGILSSINSIKSIEEKYENRICIVLAHEVIMDSTNVSAITSGCGNGSVHIKSLEEGSIKSIEHNCKFAIVDILKLMNEFNSKSELFRQTGGVHSCCICNDNSLLLFSEDMGRHNALDKVIGKALMVNMGLADKLVMTTGRISSDIIIKVAKAGIQLIASHSAPTSLAINIAKAANITIIGFARGSRMNIYCNEDRII